MELFFSLLMTVSAIILMTCVWLKVCHQYRKSGYNRACIDITGVLLNNYKKNYAERNEGGARILLEASGYLSALAEANKFIK